MTIKISQIVVVALAIVAIQALVLWWLGHTVICPCGYFKFWDNGVRGLQNSQSLLDWYSFLHVMYGMILYFGAFLLRKKFGWKLAILFLVVILISFGWEVVENTYYAIHRYQVHSVSSNYYGDSIINSVMDTVCVGLGFGLAAAMPLWAGVGIFIVLTLITTFILRDNIFLSTFTFLFPYHPVASWQAAASIYH